jgi:hypothetical protein
MCKLRNVEGVPICKESTTLLMDEDKLRAHLMINLQITAIVLLVHYFVVSCTNTAYSET